jgi:hypothetical protein
MRPTRMCHWHQMAQYSVIPPVRAAFHASPVLYSLTGTSPPSRSTCSRLYTTRKPAANARHSGPPESNGSKRRWLRISGSRPAAPGMTDTSVRGQKRSAATTCVKSVATCRTLRRKWSARSSAAIAPLGRPGISRRAKACPDGLRHFRILTKKSYYYIDVIRHFDMNSP